MNKVAIKATLKLQNAHVARAIERCGSVKELAEELGMSTSTVSHWLNFRSSPRWRHAKTDKMKQVVRKLTKLAGASLADIFPDLTKEERAALSSNHTKESVVETKNLTHSLAQNLVYEPNVEEQVDAEVLRERLKGILESLGYREREIIKLRYGLPDGNAYTLEEVAEIFEVGRERIRQIEAKALRKLQRPSRLKGLVEFVQDAVTGATCPDCRKRFCNMNAMMLHRREQCRSQPTLS